MLVFLPPLSFAVKNREHNFSQPCAAVWSAAVTVAKSQDYRIISISTEEHILSLVVGGFWGGERVISISLAPGSERGCVVTAQSRFSGVAHSDGPDFLARVHVELLGAEVDHDSKAFRKFRECLDGYNSNEAKCEEKFRERVARNGGH
jgi:hypothetical protein